MSAAGIETADDTELRYVLGELGLDYESLALSLGVPRARDVSTGNRPGTLRVPPAITTRAELASSTGEVDAGGASDPAIDLAVNPSHLSDMYSQAPQLEGAELQPLFDELLRRDRALVTAGAKGMLFFYITCLLTVQYPPAFLPHPPQLWQHRKKRH